MKKIFLTLALLLTFLSAYNQASRRPTNNKVYASDNAVRHQNNTVQTKYSVNTITKERPVSTTTSHKDNFYQNKCVKPVEYKHHDNYEGHQNNYHPETIYRSYYRIPAVTHKYWTPAIRHEYRIIYPAVRFERYEASREIVTVPSYLAIDYTGEIINVYGNIVSVTYSSFRDVYRLYLGDTYPYQDLSVIVPGWVARVHTNGAAGFFQNRDILLTGLVTSFRGEIEVYIKQAGQITIY